MKKTASDILFDKIQDDLSDQMATNIRLLKRCHAFELGLRMIANGNHQGRPEKIADEALRAGEKFPINKT